MHVLDYSINQNSEKYEKLTPHHVGVNPISHETEEMQRQKCKALRRSLHRLRYAWALLGRRRTPHTKSVPRTVHTLSR